MAKSKAGNGPVGPASSSAPEKLGFNGGMCPYSSQKNIVATEENLCHRNNAIAGRSGAI